MTLAELQHRYNFHDCDVFTPFEAGTDSITITFDLAKHLQYDDLKFCHENLISSEEYSLIVKVKFFDCLNLQVSEWLYNAVKATNKEQELDKKPIPMEQFDSNMDFISLAVTGENDICFVFEEGFHSKKMSEIRFQCNSVEVLEEKFVDNGEYEKLWQKFEADNQK